MKQVLVNIPQVCEFNSYINKLSSIQRNAGIHVLESPAKYSDCISNNKQKVFDTSSIECLFKNHNDMLKIIHLHWPEKFYNSENGLDFISELSILKERGYKIVRTLHNLCPHDNVELKLIDNKITNISDLIHVFSKEQEIYINKYFNVDVCTIPHLNYFETIPVSTTDIKELIGFQKRNRKVLLFFGRLRNYKNIIDFIKSIQINTNNDLLFFIAGLSENKEIEEKFKDLCNNDKRVIFINRLIAENEILSLFQYTDAVILPYESWSSGMAILSINLGKLIIGKLPKSVERTHFFLESKIDSFSLSNSYNLFSQIKTKTIKELGIEGKSMLAINNDQITTLYKKMYSRWV